MAFIKAHLLSGVCWRTHPVAAAKCTLMNVIITQLQRGRGRKTKTGRERDGRAEIRRVDTRLEDCNDERQVKKMENYGENIARQVAK